MVISAMVLRRAIVATKLTVAVAAMVCAGLVATFPAAMAGASNVDRLGVNEIYLLKPGGRQWFLIATDPRDGFVISPAASVLYAKPGGSWQIGRETGCANTCLRIYVILPDGWRDVGMTAFVKLRSYTFD